MSPRNRIVVSSIAGIGLSLTPLGAPGLFAAALVFPQGIEGDHGWLYLFLAVTINFLIFFFVVYQLIELLSKRKISG
jgi:Na+/H+-dicarboxylate symporter